MIDSILKYQKKHIITDHLVKPESDDEYFIKKDSEKIKVMIQKHIEE